MEGERRVEESKYYKFEVVKDKLPKRGNKIDWMNVKDIYIYCVNLNSTYKLKVIDRKRNARGELYLYLSYNVNVNIFLYKKWKIIMYNN